jgi:hypothetical protein
MTTVPLASPLPVGIPSTARKKRVLLVDNCPHKRELRSEIMRKLGMEVDCAADINEARSWWRADLYNLVLVSVTGDMIQRDKFCGEVRGATPPQQIAFFVGKPEYLAGSPSAYGESSVESGDDHVLVADTRATLSVDPSDQPLRWGILEASRRISAARSASNARTQAMRKLPAPARDSEARPSRRATSPSLGELIKEGTQ